MQPQDLIICGQKCGPEWQKQLNEKKSIDGLSKKTKLDNARKLRGIDFVDLDDKEEFQETIENARKKLELANGSSHAL